MSSETIVDGLKYVLQNVRLQSGDIWQKQVNIVNESITEITRLNARVKELEAKISADAKYYAMRNELNKPGGEAIS